MKVKGTKTIFTMFLLMNAFVSYAKGNADWMSKLNNNTPVCRVSIPGTHDTMTGHGFLNPECTEEYTTQTATLEEQMRLGIRYFDMRLAFNTDAKGDTILQTCHRTALIPVTAMEMLKMVTDYLKKHPKEFFIIKIQRDDAPLDKTEMQKQQSADRWNRLVQKMIQDTKSIGGENIFADFKPNMTVGEMRGKILLLSRTSYGTPVCGALTNWIDEGTEEYKEADFVKERTLWLSPVPEAATAYKGGMHKKAARLYVQDFYNTIGDRIEAKKMAVEKMFESSLTSADNTWILNHTSGFTSPSMCRVGYAANARAVNGLLSKLLKDNAQEGTTGIVAMDFAGVKECECGLIEQIIRQNFKVNKKGKTYNVKDFGARGDGVTLDTEAINEAIEAASKQGGGMVVLDKGTYLSHSIHLKSDITLKFEEGAILKAAPATESAGYDEPEDNPSRFQDFGHSHWKNSLIWGIGLKNVSIISNGQIEGNDALSRIGVLRGRDANNNIHIANKALAMRDCQNVRIDGVTFVKCGHFAILMTGVDNLRIENVIIDSDRDGIDIDCCEDVILRHCKVNTINDDAIVLKCSYGLNRLKPTARVIIEDCDVSGYDLGAMINGSYTTNQPKAPDGDGPTGRIKLGTESNGGFKDIIIRDCRFKHCRGLALETVDGAEMENVYVDNIAMDDICNSPLYIVIGKRMRGPEGLSASTVRNIKISNVNVRNADCRYGCLISGMQDSKIRDVEIENVDIEYLGGITLEDVKTQSKGNDFFRKRHPNGVDLKGYPEPSAHGIQPAWGVSVYNADNIRFKNATMRLLNADERQQVYTENVENFISPVQDSLP